MHLVCAHKKVVVIYLNRKITLSDLHPGAPHGLDKNRWHFFLSEDRTMDIDKFLLFGHLKKVDQ